LLHAKIAELSAQFCALLRLFARERWKLLSKTGGLRQSGSDAEKLEKKMEKDCMMAAINSILIARVALRFAVTA
jgi:hypothetical protein